MQSQQKEKVAAMLTDAYRQLGISSVCEIDARIKEALNYLELDREHYIEVVDSDTPEYYITTRNGVICKLIPMAYETIQDAEEDHIRQHTAIFSLMLSDAAIRYVYAYSYAKIYADPTQNTYTHPVYRFAELTDIRKSLHVHAPCEIRPIATQRDWNIYRMMFAVFAQLNRSQSVNSIPHKTERAMLATVHARPESITVDGKTMRGKMIPLAWKKSMWAQMREDHRYSYSKDLYLFITETDLHYLLKTRHVYDYFRVIPVDDVPGGNAYEPTEQKQENTYEIVTLADIHKDMHPLYY